MSLKKPKVVVLSEDNRKVLKPHTLGHRNIEDLAKEMYYYVEYIKKKGVKVVLNKKSK